MNFKKIFNKLLIFIFLISIISVPNIVFAYTKKVVLGGENIGIKVNSNGVLVVGFYQIDGKNPAKDAGLRIGDRIIKINDTDINTTGTFGNITQVNGNNLSFEITIGNPGEGQVYNPGDEYVISLQPMNRDLIPVNFNIPIFRSNTITLEINEVV